MIRVSHRILSRLVSYYFVCCPRPKYNLLHTNLNPNPDTDPDPDSGTNIDSDTNIDSGPDTDPNPNSRSIDV